jgi:hypothetical protein
VVFRTEKLNSTSPFLQDTRVRLRSDGDGLGNCHVCSSGLYLFCIDFYAIFIFVFSLLWCSEQNKRIDTHDIHGIKREEPFKATKELTALTSEIDCDQTAMGSPPATSAVFS